MAWVESYVAPRLSLRRCSSALALFALYIEVLAGTKTGPPRAFARQVEDPLTRAERDSHTEDARARECASLCRTLRSAMAYVRMGERLERL